MTKIEKEIVKMIEDKFGYPYMTYDKAEQTWTNNYFLFDIKTETIYSSDKVKLELGKRFGAKFIENNYFNLISKWFKISNKYNVKHVEQYLSYMELNKIIKKVLRESIVVETDEDWRKVKLIQRYMDTIFVPNDDLVCKANVVRFVDKDEYAVTIWINENIKYSQDDSDELVDDVWDAIYNMFEIPVSVRRLKSKC